MKTISHFLIKKNTFTFSSALFWQILNKSNFERRFSHEEFLNYLLHTLGFVLDCCLEEVEEADLSPLYELDLSGRV